MLESSPALYKVGYIYSEEFQAVSDLLPSNLTRSSHIHSLVQSYGLFCKVELIPPSLASFEDLTLFHSEDFVRFLLELDELQDGSLTKQEKLKEFGLLHDCPIFPQLTKYVQLLAGAATLAGDLLLEGGFQTVINWDGGRHHGKSNSAAGFCYINDACLSIIKLLEGYRRVLYIDLDLHHGDGVEEAFYYSSQVFTVSLHRHDPGFYPGSGSFASRGRGRGINHCLNIPLKSGLCDANLITIFDEAVSHVKRTFLPEVVVLQCGVDGLVGDNHREWNLTIKGYSDCIGLVQSWGLPTLVLGGGGYNHPNTARCYAQLTSLLVNSPLIPEWGRVQPIPIPENPYFSSYGPDFTLQIDKEPSPDNNTEEYISSLIHLVKKHLEIGANVLDSIF